MPDQPRVYSLHRLPAPVASRLEVRFAMDWNVADQDLPLAEIIEAARRCDALISTVTDPIPAAVFEARGRRARMVANFGVGVDRIDLAAARRAEVVVTNTPGALTDCTADLAMTLIAMTLRRVGEGERQVRAGRWEGWRPTHLLGRRVSGKALGIVGMGRIGRAVAQRARAGFGMTIRYASRTRLDPATEAALDARQSPLDDLLAESDVISLHCPLTPETSGLIDRTRLARIRPDAVLINTARGALVDEEALAEALAAGRLAGAGLDVYVNEPVVSAALVGLDNVVLLPHQGSATMETRVAMGMLVADNLEAFFDGRPAPHRVA